MRLFCVSFVALLGWVASSPITYAAQQQQSSSIQLQVVLQERTLAVYALYNLPPFRVTFQTRATEELRAQQQQQQGQPLVVEVVDTLSYPLRTITEGVLKEQFELDILNLMAVTDDSSKRNEYDIFNHLVAVDLQTKLYFSNDGSGDGDGGDSSRRRTSRNRRNLSEHVTLVAEMYGTVAFVEPNDRQTKPSNEQVLQVFGEFIRNYFQDHRDLYLQALMTQSEEPVLQQITSLVILTDVGTETATITESSSSNGWSVRAERALLTCLLLAGLGTIALVFVYAREHHVVKKRAQELYGYHEDGGESVDFYLDNPHDPHGHYNTGTTRASPPHARERMNSMDAVRHGANGIHYDSAGAGALSILEASDRYLSKHRPDLFEGGGSARGMPCSTVEQRNSRSGGARKEGRTSAFSYYSGSAEEESTGIFRNYVIPSNPFEYIYSAATDVFSSTFSNSTTTMTTNKTTPTAATANKPGNFASASAGGSEHRRSYFTPRENRQSSLEIQKENFAADQEDAYEHYDNVELSLPRHHRSAQAAAAAQAAASTSNRQAWPGANVWRNIAGLWEDSSYSSNHHPIYQEQNPELYASENNEEQYHHHHPHDEVEWQQQFAEEEEHYNFPFQDFPRRDGTPCLMYNEAHHKIFRISDDDDGGVDNADKATTPVSNHAFQRMLSNHSFDIQYSFEGDNNNNNNNNKEEDQKDKEFTCAKENPFFKNKLDRIVAQRHRQYEKRTIVEKHQEQRAKERTRYRERERHERHKAMENSIADIEATTFSPLERARRPQQQQGQHHSPHRGGGNGGYMSQSSYSPHKSPSHRHTNSSGSSQYSPKLLSRGSTYSPSHRSNRSPIPPRSPYSRTDRDREAAHSISPKPMFRTGTGTASDGIFRPVPKTSYSDDSNNNHVSKSSSGRSVSPPGGLEEDIYSSSLSSSLAFRKSNLHLDTSYNSGLAPSSSSAGNKHIDDFTLDKLTMPGMGRSPHIPSKHISPQSVMDEIMTPPSLQARQQQPSKNDMHRRGSSFSNVEEKKNGDLDGISVGSSGADSRKSHRRVNSHQPPHPHPHYPPTSSITGTMTQQPQQQQQQHRRKRSSSNNSMRRPHSRSNSQTDDVMLHGIYAQTRFV
jgi:hypothetical protein